MAIWRNFWYESGSYGLDSALLLVKTALKIEYEEGDYCAGT
ncbi:MAG: hypothetical protein PHH28_13075 [Desulfuromonadaceae bacterium]|nr:hypothetical protein [Desulfuromonadaceae bacterium]